MTDEQIRAFLDANPDVLREFLEREARRDPRWLDDFIRRQEAKRRAQNPLFLDALARR